MRIKFFLLLMLTLLWLKPAAVLIAEPHELPVRIFRLETDGSVKVYTLNEANELEQTGSITLPEGFNIKKYPQRPNIILSPGGDKAAFTAKNQDDETGFFIYDFGTDELEQGFIARFTNFFMHLVWSPDGNFVMLEPIYQDGGRGELPYPETYTYELATKRWSALTTNPGRTGERFIWMRNSQSLKIGRIFTNNPDNIMLVDPYGTTLKALEPAPDLPLPGCDVNWLEATRRWYYNMECPIHYGDVPPVHEAIYSMNEIGNIRLELDINAFFPEVGEKSEYEADAKVIAIETGKQAIYALVYLNFFITTDEISGSQEFHNVWRIVEITEPEQAKIAYEYAGDDFTTGNGEGLLSADEHYFMFWENRVETSRLMIADVVTGSTLMEKDIPNRICAAQWLYSTQILYNECDSNRNYGNIYLIDLKTGDTIRLTQEQEIQFILLAPVRSNLW